MLSSRLKTIQYLSMRARNIYVYYINLNRLDALDCIDIRYPYCDGKLCFEYFVFAHVVYTRTHTYATHANIHCEKMVVSYFLVFNQNACLTYRCQTSLVLITNIAKVLFSSVSYLMSHYYLQSLCLHIFISLPFFFLVIIIIMG